MARGGSVAVYPAHGVGIAHPDETTCKDESCSEYSCAVTRPGSSVPVRPDENLRRAWRQKTWFVRDGEWHAVTKRVEMPACTVWQLMPDSTGTR